MLLRSAEIKPLFFDLKISKGSRVEGTLSVVALVAFWPCLDLAFAASFLQFLLVLQSLRVLVVC